MREILFKSKRIDNGEWIEGYYVKTYNNQGKLTDRIFREFGADEGNEWGFFEIDPETLCQYTGLKDKNGKRIWENDICKMVYDGKSHTYVIVWDEEEFDFKGTNGKKNYGRNFEYLGCCEEIVRTGNIFDNPELLGQDGD